MNFSISPEHFTFFMQILNLVKVPYTLVIFLTMRRQNYLPLAALYGENKCIVILTVKRILQGTMDSISMGFSSTWSALKPPFFIFIKII